MPIKTGMVLAAGKGERLRPITDTCPKPLVTVGKSSMLDRAIDALGNHGVTTVVVNVSYHKEMIIEHLKLRAHPHIIISEEPERLETGGGVLKALPHLGPKPFYVINGDILWSNAQGNALDTLQKTWNDSMDALLLLIPLKNARGYDGEGDYVKNSKGQLSRRTSPSQTAYIYGGVQIIHPRLFEGETEPYFSLNKLYDKAQEKGTLYGIEHKGLWFHVGTPQSLMETRAWFEENQLAETK